jgi:predicted CopG family antitoxin
MSKSVRLSEEAYERLKALRCENETISDVVLRLTGERSLLELAGILSDEQADALEDVIENRRTRQVELESAADEMRDA